MTETPKKGFLDRIMSEADDSAHPFLEKIQENIKLIGIIAAAAIIIFSVYSLNSFWQERKISQANSKLESILSQEDPESRLSMLEEYLTEAPDRVKGAILLETARTSMNMEDYSRAADSFNQLSDLDSDMRPIAVLGSAKAYELKGNNQQAVDTLKNESLPDEFKVQYLTLLSFNAEKAGDNALALDAYEKLLKEAQGADVGFIEYKIELLSQNS
ncbi:MAG: tetratricopeptide repeat protein [Desulfovibrionales bacterium]|nr:tetratricopeptide repeat protein [Desulfovibrionales bacterium]